MRGAERGGRNESQRRRRRGKEGARGRTEDTHNLQHGGWSGSNKQETDL